MRRHIQLHIRHGIYNKQKQSSLHKNGLFLRRYKISNANMIENYKSCHMPDRRKNVCDQSLHSCNNGVSFALVKLGHMGWDISRHGLFMRFSLAWPTGW